MTGIDLSITCVMNPDTFHKLVVSKWSPKNGCNVPEGEVLSLVPRIHFPKNNRDAGHYFVSARNPQIKSKFGWVKEVEAFTLDEFIATHVGDKRLEERAKESIRTLLGSVMSLPAGTSVAATYFCKGVIEHKMVLNVHKVVFYPAKNCAGSGDQIGEAER